MSVGAMWVASFGLLLLRGLLAASESALYGTSELRARELSVSEPRRGARLLRHKTEREATAAAIRFGMVLLGFTAAALGTLAGARFFAGWLGTGFWELGPAFVGVLVVGLVASMIDVTLRAGAATNPEAWALRLSGPLSWVVLLLYPPMRIMVALLNLATRPFGARVRFEAPAPPLDELEKLLAAQAAKAQVDKSAPQLIRSIFELSDKTCRDVMVPRTAVVGFEYSSRSEDILSIIAEENHSRIPVYRDDLDHIVGVLHVRDIVPMMMHPELIVLGDLIRPAHYVPWVKPIGDLLREMQREKIHMAMVVDEYGGFMGIVTLEDILREIVGDIGDEFEKVEAQFEKQADGSYLVDASIVLSDFSHVFNVALPEGDYETLGGFLSSLAGAIPEVGERFSFSTLQFTVHSKAGPRIERIRIQKLKSAPPREKENKIEGQPH